MTDQNVYLVEDESLHMTYPVYIWCLYIKCGYGVCYSLFLLALNISLSRLQILV